MDEIQPIPLFYDTIMRSDEKANVVTHDHGAMQSQSSKIGNHSSTSSTASIQLDHRTATTPLTDTSEEKSSGAGAEHPPLPCGTITDLPPRDTAKGTFQELRV